MSLSVMTQLSVLKLSGNDVASITPAGECPVFTRSSFEQSCFLEVTLEALFAWRTELHNINSSD